jgi:DNA-directed RNA polymerase subunit K/omega
MDDKNEIDFEEEDIEVNDSDNESVDSINIENETKEEYDDEVEEEDDEEEVVPGDGDNEEEDDEVEEEDDEEEVVPGSENNIMENNINYEDSDDDDLDEDYLQKIDKETQSSIIKEYHPEMIVHNRDEIKTSCHIVRNSQGNIIDPLHKTLPFVTSYERARVIGERAKQIEAGAKPFIEVSSNMVDGYLIALKEFENKKIPFIIQRPLPNGTSEYWKLSDLEII